MKCKYCTVEMEQGFAAPESLHLDYERHVIVEFPEIHTDAHKKLILVMKCPKCGHSEHMEKQND